jgi:predicted Co/Zn/Cd cation transporter (cation efflux family)
MLFMVTICTFMAGWHHRNWVKTQRKSDLLKTERKASVIDGLLSAAAGAAFGLIALLKGTALAFLVPISDAIVVLCLATLMIPQPIRSFIDAVKEVLGESAGEQTIERWRLAINDALAATTFSLVEVAVTKLGRSHFAVAYIRPETAVTVEALDQIKDQLDNTTQSIHSPSRMEIIFTGTYPYA